MNKKAQGSLGTAIIVAIMIFIVGLTSINYITPEVDNARNETIGLNCANSTAISDGTKLTCLAVDMAVPYFIILIFSVAGGYITARFLI